MMKMVFILLIGMLTGNIFADTKPQVKFAKVTHYKELFETPFNCLTVTATNPLSKVLIDGKEVGRTPFATGKLKPGKYYLEVIDPIDGVYGREITIHKLMPVYIKADFTKKPNYYSYRHRRQYERERFLNAWILAGAVEIPHPVLMPLVALAIGNELLNTHRFSAIEDNDWEYSRTYVDFINEQVEKRKLEEEKKKKKVEVDISNYIKSFYSESFEPEAFISNKNSESLDFLFSDGKNQYLYFVLKAGEERRVRLKAGHNFITIKSGKNIPKTFREYFKNFREYHIKFELKEG